MKRPSLNVLISSLFAAGVCYTPGFYRDIHSAPSFTSPVQTILKQKKCAPQLSSYGQWTKFQYGWVYSKFLKPKSQEQLKKTEDILYFEKKLGAKVSQSKEGRYIDIIMSLQFLS